MSFCQTSHWTLFLSQKNRKRTTKTEIENKVDNESPLKSYRGSTLHTRQASCFSSQPWPSLVHRVHSKKSSPANSLGQDPSLTAALENMSLKLLNFEISQGMRLLEVVAPQRLFQIMLPCATCRGAVMMTEWSDHGICHLFPTHPRHKVVCFKGIAQALVLLHAGSSFGSQVSCLGFYSFGVITEGEGQSFEQGVYFLISFCRTPASYFLHHHCIAAEQCCIIHLFKHTVSAQVNWESSEMLLITP